jgi:hypothetical protein
MSSSLEGLQDPPDVGGVASLASTVGANDGQDSSIVSVVRAMTAPAVEQNEPLVPKQGLDLGEADLGGGRLHFLE